MRTDGFDGREVERKVGDVWMERGWGPCQIAYRGVVHAGDLPFRGEHQGAQLRTP
jgi:hypothetical protein